ncbi:MAG: DUF4197 domain-containing protein [Thermodesulfovibrionales bacterium]|nr:DUF4197 domain-containing protein [Thermodesulfovibrionales bacterium]
MKKFFISIIFVFLMSTITYAGLLDNLLKGADIGLTSKKDEQTVANGLKEALTIGTEKAVKNVSQKDGYFSNQIIKILLPEEIQSIATVLSRFGFQKEIDNFILTMNRAAEKAAPMATSYFVDAIKSMTIEDAMGILNGGNTSATDFFKRKTSDKLYTAFKPVVSDSMNKVGTVNSYKSLTKGIESIPFIEQKSFDLDHYVTTKALDGLFYMVGEEEKKIRTDPAARVTDLLKTVFGK